MKLETLSARDNPLLVRIRKLVADPGAYRKQAQVWLEGDHLISAALARKRGLAVLVVAQSFWDGRADCRLWAEQSTRVVLVPDALFAQLSSLESPARVGALIDLGATPEPLLPERSAVVLDRLQDAGNVGSILRSAAAFGVAQVLALKGTAALWSPKVVRAGMGAHFALRLVEGLQAEDLAGLRLPLLATSSHQGLTLGRDRLPQPCAWVMGHEGQGVSPALMAQCAHTVRIPQPGGEESLNVAAAAAICLFSTQTSPAAPV